MTSDSIAQQFQRILEDLTGEFAGRVPAAEVSAVIDHYRAEIEPAAKIQDFIPVLVRRYARETLQDRVKQPA